MALPFLSDRAARSTRSQISDLIKATSSITKYDKDTPRNESWLSAPRMRIFLPFTKLISRLLMCADLMTGFPKSINKSHIIVLACPRVGATYITLEPSGQFNPSINRVTADNLDFPQRRPAAITLNRVWSLNTVCCHLSSLKSRFINVLNCYIGDIVINHFFCFYCWTSQSTNVNTNLRSTATVLTFKA